MKLDIPGGPPDLLAPRLALRMPLAVRENAPPRLGNGLSASYILC